MRQIKMLKINQNNIKNGEVINITDTNFIKTGTYNFLIKTLETYRGKNYEDNEKVSEIIKVMLPDSEELAKKQWDEGIKIDKVTYKAWFATVGGMKQEDTISKSKCEVLFISDTISDFKEYFEDVVSLGKFGKLNKNEERYVNKEILSRLSLATSDLITEIEMPNLIILPTYKLDWKRTYKAVTPITTTYKNENGEDTEGIDYDLIDYDFDDQLELFDGGGIATHQVMNSIGKSLNRNDVDFAIIRGYGLGIKGMVTRFNILRYLSIMHEKIGDTEYCKKENNKFYLLDMYGNWREVTDNTLLLNETMVKLADKFSNIEDYFTQLNKYNSDEDMDIYNLLNKLYITKVNKKEEDLNEYRRLNYQFFNALALTDSEYNELASQDFKLFKKLLKPYDIVDKDTKEFKANVDIINIFYNQCCNDENELDDLKEINNVVDKTNVLININKDNIKLNYVKKNLAKLLEKRIRDLAKGRLTIKATYNYIAVDPVSYMNFAMTREQGENGLKKDQFYCSNIDDSEIRTIFRNPLMAHSEIHNIKFIRNQFFDNWLCKSPEIVYFNQKSDIQTLLGSADSDGDAVTVVDNKIIRNAVIETDKPFCFTADGKKVKCKFDDEGRFLATYKPSGNLIGQIATLAVRVNNNSQTLKDYYRSDKDKFYSWAEIKKILEEKDKYDINNGKSFDEKIDIVNKAIKKLIEKDALQYSSSVDNGILRKKIKQQFLENLKDIYSLLYCSSLTIDSPKTMNVIDVEKYTRVVREKYEDKLSNKKGDYYKKIYKASFLQYAKRKFDVNENDYSINKDSVLDKFAERVEKELLTIIDKRKKDFTDNTKFLQKQLDNKQYDKESAEVGWDKLTDMYSNYVHECNEVQNAGYDRATKNRALQTIEAEYTLIANDLMDKYDIYSISVALSKLEPCSERFIISFFMNCLIEVDKLSPSLKSFYIKDENGDIEYMYERYRKSEKTMNLSDSAKEKLAINDLVKLKLATQVRFKTNEVEKIVSEIEKGLIKDGYYELDITNLEVFDEFKTVVQGKSSIKVNGFMLKNDGTKAISKKSFGVYFINY